MSIQLFCVKCGFTVPRNECQCAVCGFNNAAYFPRPQPVLVLILRRLGWWLVVLLAALTLAALLTATHEASAHELSIQRAWSNSEYQCSMLAVGGGGGPPSWGHGEGVCEQVTHTGDADHLFQSGFDEEPWGYWSYRVQLNGVVVAQEGCAMAYFNTSVVTGQTYLLLICNG